LSERARREIGAYLVIVMFEPFHDRISNRREPTIGIATTACWICLFIVFVSISIYEGIPFGEYLFLCTSSVPDEESICTGYGYIRWIHHYLSIDDRVEMFHSICLIHLIISRTEIVGSYAPSDIGQEIPPSTRCHMDMDESSLAIMEMDAICGEDSFSDIAPRYFFHVVRWGKVPLLPIDIYGEIGMPMGLIWSWSEYISSSDTEYDEKNRDDIFLHS
jgi:hypothetical protein